MSINIATADKAELKAYAANNLDLNLTLNMNEDTMRDKIIERCAELQIEPPIAKVEARGKLARKGINRTIINIAKQDRPGGSDPAFVGVQGVGYLIPRGMDISVPDPVVEVLKNAVQEIVTQDPDSGEILREEVRTYPFSILGPDTAHNGSEAA